MRLPVFFSLVSLVAAAEPASEFVRQRLNLSQPDMILLQQGTPVSYELKTPDPAEILVYGAVRIRSTCEAFAASYSDVEKLVDGKSYLGVRKFSVPPKLSDLADLVLNQQDLLELRKCRPGDCEIQMPGELMEQFRGQVDWNGATAAQQAQTLVSRTALEALAAYQTGGNQALGVYNDKDHPTRVAEAFRTVIGRAKELPVYFPDFYRYLTDFPVPGPDRTTDFYYWENVKFGLKPTFRINHVSIYQPSQARDRWLIANKQLYASHYFQTAIDLSLCIHDDATRFYLLTLKGSRQDGLTGIKGRTLRSVIVSRTKEALTLGLRRLKEKSEAGR